MKSSSFWTEFRERQEERREQFLADFERKKEKMDREYERDCNEAMKAVSGMMNEFSAWEEYCKRKGAEVKE